MRHSDNLSYLISHTLHICLVHYSKSPLVLMTRANEGSEREFGKGISCWDAEMARVFYGPDFIYEVCARDGSQAGRPTCCSCPGNIQQWSKGSRRHQQNLFTFQPLPSCKTLYLPFPPFIQSLSEKTWPPARCWCHGCHRNRSLTPTRLNREGEVRGKSNYGSPRWELCLAGWKCINNVLSWAMSTCLCMWDTQSDKNRIHTEQRSCSYM